jgi:aspartyl-tRNA(Asn)/glutamyl-tRNA(Gln) amidotransferase subunit C
MAGNERVVGEDVKRVAELAHLELGLEEEVRMQRDLNAILDDIAQLNELDTTSVEPMAQVAEVLQGASSVTILRADVQKPCLAREQVIISAPLTDGAFFKVPKVIER